MTTRCNILQILLVQSTVNSSTGMMLRMKSQVDLQQSLHTTNKILQQCSNDIINE